ncbi:hypothetical protein AB0G02_04735 [Actinosynnema sp. NPDC023658]|uniref:hypothetical protein n=1 Tax=Actinosynnema sp. NPDC023658 TaxID=3155465 RepID=UPI0033CFE506
MRVALVSLAAAVLVVVAPGAAQATNWITVGPYPTQESCQYDKDRYHQIYPAWGCYQQDGGWYFQYNRV